MTKLRRMRELLASARPLLSPGAFDGYSLRLVEAMGYESASTSGAGLANSLLGQPDIGILSLSQNVDACRHLARSVSIPLMADADTGYGNAVTVYHVVQYFEEAGVVGINLEDQVMPKRCGHFARKQVVSTGEMLARIRAAVRARSNPDFTLFARTDARAVHGLDDAIDRVNRFGDAGADVAFIEAPQSVAELELIPRRVARPLLANMLTGGVTPILSVAELDQLGYKLAVAPIESLLVTARAVRDLCTAWQTKGRVDDLSAAAMSFAELKKLLGVETFTAPQDKP